MAHLPPRQLCRIAPRDEFLMCRHLFCTLTHQRQDINPLRPPHPPTYSHTFRCTYAAGDFPHSDEKLTVNPRYLASVSRQVQKQRNLVLPWGYNVRFLNSNVFGTFCHKIYGSPGVGISNWIAHTGRKQEEEKGCSHFYPLFPL